MDEIRVKDGFNGGTSIVLPREFLQTAASNPLVSPLYITDIGMFPHARYHYIERRQGISEHILIFCVEGSGYVVAGGKKTPVRENCVLYIRQGVPHVYAADDKKPWSIFWVHFAGGNAAQFFADTAGDYRVLLASPEHSSRLMAQFTELMDAFLRGYTLDTMVYSSQLFAFMLGMLFFKSGAITRPETVIEHSVDLMLAHLGEHLSLSYLAQAANLSPTQFSYLFRKKTGFSPIDYFLRLKIHQACQYLDSTEMRINEIAAQLGFSDPYYFSREFSKVMGSSPTAYRQISKG